MEDMPTGQDLDAFGSEVLQTDAACLLHGHYSCNFETFETTLQQVARHDWNSSNVTINTPEAKDTSACLFDQDWLFFNTYITTATVTCEFNNNSCQLRSQTKECRIVGVHGCQFGLSRAEGFA